MITNGEVREVLNQQSQELSPLTHALVLTKVGPAPSLDRKASTLICPEIDLAIEVK
jgi:hypothetical protein